MGAEGIEPPKSEDTCFTDRLQLTNSACAHSGVLRRQNASLSVSFSALTTPPAEGTGVEPDPLTDALVSSEAPHLWGIAFHIAGRAGGLLYTSNTG